MKLRMTDVKNRMKKDFLLFVIDNWDYNQKLTIDTLSYITGISHYHIISYGLKDLIKEANEKIKASQELKQIIR